MSCFSRLALRRSKFKALCIVFLIAKSGLVKPLRNAFVVRKMGLSMPVLSAWIESQIQSTADVLAWSRRTSNSVHFGSLMVIVSVKGAELSPDSWKLKARIVFRGDNIRDECGMSAVFDELYFSSPSSLEGLNITTAFGLLDSHGVSVSDAIKAYVQSELKSPTHTYVMLPPELVPDDKKHVKDPCARLYKALYGHPWSSASWYLHLDSILKGLGGQEFPNLPSVYYFPHLSLVLCVYVDDLTSRGPTISHEGFWSSSSKQVDLQNLHSSWTGARSFPSVCAAQRHEGLVS